MAPRSGRRPFVNFFVKRDVQIGVMKKIIGGMVIATVVSWAIILLAYFIRYRSVLIYQMDTSGNLNKETVFTILLPSLMVSVIINIVIAAFVGMYTSRKHVIPIYRFEKWAQSMRTGDLFTRLFFREKRQMQDVCGLFNGLTDEYRARFLLVERALEEYDNRQKIDEATRKQLKEMMEGLELHEQ